MYDVFGVLQTKPLGSCCQCRAGIHGKGHFVPGHCVRMVRGMMPAKFGTDD
jgi:hypothetical protein